MDEPELELIAARAATVVTNPVSNLKLAVGRVFPYSKARAAGIAVGLGTDGAASNNSLDLFQDVKVFALLQKFADDDPAVLPAAEAWAVVIGAFAPNLGASGALAVGEPADFLLVRGDAAELTPGAPDRQSRVRGVGSVVASTVVDGTVLMRDGVIEDEAEVCARATERAERLGVL